MIIAPFLAVGVSLVLMLRAAEVRAGDRWTQEDTELEAVYLLLHFRDFGQTRFIAKNPDQFHEINPILGEHPSVGRVNTYFLTTAALHAFVASVLPRKARRVFQHLTIGVEFGQTERNAQIGIQVDF